VLDRCCGRVAAAASDVNGANAAGLARPVASLVGQILLAQRLAGDANPPLPFGGGLRWVVGVKEQLPAPGTDTGLRLEQTLAVLIQ